jgi:5'-3' exonuclease
VVQVDRRGNRIRNEAEVIAKFGVAPALIPDYLALVGDAADGYPGIPGIGAATAARLLARHGPIEQFPAEVLGQNHELALRFRTLALLRADVDLFASVDELEWRGAGPGFPAFAERFGDARLVERVARLAALR